LQKITTGQKKPRYIDPCHKRVSEPYLAEQKLPHGESAKRIT
jgi:hypothetical protein